MTLIQIQGQPKRFEVPGTSIASASSVASMATRPKASSPLAQLFEIVFATPLISAFIFGIAFQFILFILHYITHHNLLEFFPTRPLYYLGWLPEFVLPYVGLKLLAVGHRKNTVAMNARISQSLERGNEIQKVSILGFAKISEVRDPDTGDHIVRMSHYSRMLAQEMAKVPEYVGYITKTYCDEIFIAAPLHDIGKVGIKDDVLKKQGGLTAEEFEIMKMHTIIGGDLLHELELKLGWRTFYSLSKEIAYHHHQRYDGTGYPNVLGASRAMFVEPGIGKQLSAKAIPLSARIVALADVYDALVSRRCYKDPIPHDVARQMIITESGKHFDPDLVQAFIRIEPELIRVAQEFSK